MMIYSASRIFILFLLPCLTTASQPVQIPRAASPGGHSSALKDEPVVVTVNLLKSLNTITDHFIGHSLGWPTAIQLSHHFGSTKLQHLAKKLAPLWVRMGGDYVTYVMDGRNFSGPGNVMKADQWASFNNFFHTVGWDLIMIVSGKTPRNKDGSWNPSNARELLQFSAHRNYNIAGFELGNEYDMYKSPFSTMVTPQQLAKDVHALRKLLSEFHKYRSSFIMGPDTAFLGPHFFHGFLAAGGHEVVRAASFHQYYFSGHHGNLSYLTDIKTMDKLVQKIDDAMSQSRSVDPQLPVWLSETGSAASGGVEGMTDRFGSGFLWLDKLGVCAAKGIPTVIRHVFYGDSAHYGIIDKNLNPNTDYWLTVLYKRIVRGAVFNVTGRHDVRVYAACANLHNFKAGGLAVYMLNPNNYPVTFDLPQFNYQPRFRWTLTPGDHNGLTSKSIALNGVKLQLVNNDLPPLKPESAPHGVVSVPAHSFTFLVFPDAGVSICLH